MESPSGFSPFRRTDSHRGDASTTRDLSFYDQPDDFSSMANSPLATPTSDTSTISRSRSRSSSTSSFDSVGSDGASSCSSVEQVFFGPVGTKEQTLIAKLSKVHLEVDSERMEEKHFDKENSKRRVTRRDSKEFHRRKTLVFSSRASLANCDSPQARLWGNGFYFKGDEKLLRPQTSSKSSSPLALWSSANTAKPSFRLNSPRSSSTPTKSQPFSIPPTDTLETDPFIEPPTPAVDFETDIQPPEEDRTLLSLEQAPQETELTDQQEDASHSADSEKGEDEDELSELSDADFKGGAFDEEEEEEEGLAKPDLGVEAEIEMPGTPVKIAADEPGALDTELETLRLDELEMEEGVEIEVDNPQVDVAEVATPSIRQEEMLLPENVSNRTISSRRSARSMEKVAVSRRAEIVEAAVDPIEAVEVEAELSVDAAAMEEYQDTTSDLAAREREDPIEKENSVVLPNAVSSDGKDLPDDFVSEDDEERAEDLDEIITPVTSAEVENEHAPSNALINASGASDRPTRWEGTIKSLDGETSETTLEVAADVTLEAPEVGSAVVDSSKGPIEEPEIERIPSTPDASTEVLEPVLDATPSRQSEDGETTFDPESPMPVCRAPKPELMMGFSPLGKRDMDQDILPLGRQTSLSPVAHTAGVTKFHLGAFDLAKDDLGSSTLRVRQALSPERRNVSASHQRLQATPVRTPSKQADAPRSGFLQRSIALPPVTKMLDRKLMKSSTPRTDLKRLANDVSGTGSGRRSGKPVVSARAVTTSTTALPILSPEKFGDTPAKSRRKSLRSAANSSAAEAPATMIDETLGSRSTIAMQETPPRPIQSQQVEPSPSAVPRAAQSTESKLRQPTKSLLKKPSASFLPVLKSTVVPSRSAASTCASSAIATTSHTPSTTTFDFAQPVPNQKITNYAPAAKTRPVVPTIMKSPVKQPDVFTSLGPPVRPNRGGPIVSTSRGPPVRPNMTPVRGGGIRSFGSPVRSNMSPTQNPTLSTPQRPHQFMALGTPQAVHVGLNSPALARRIDTARSRLHASTTSHQERSTLSMTAERPLQHRPEMLPRSRLAEQTESEPAVVPVERVPPPAPSTTSNTAVVEPTVAPVPPAATAELTVLEPPAASTSRTSRRSARPARTAVNLASSATSEAVKPSRAAGGRREKTKVAPTSTSGKATIVVDLESITKLNTARNEVVFSAITTIKQRRQGERPRGDPLTIAEKIASLSREERALRRQLEKSGATSEDEDRPSGPLDSHRRGPGETEDYTTPARPGKRAREESESPTCGPAAKKSRIISGLPSATGSKEERRVKWDKGLIMISDSRKTPSEASSQSQVVKGCLKKNVMLDNLGNVPNASLAAPGLQPLPVEVLKIRYDGEDFSDGEPGEPKSIKRAEKSKGKKKAVATEK